MKEEKKPTIEEEVTKDCPILFNMLNKPCTETCMCWGFECQEGWHNEIAEACRELEMLNETYYPKYRVRIQADQIKEKYGTIRFYYSIVTDPCATVTFFMNAFERLEERLQHVKYCLKTVVDIEPFDYDEMTELTKEQYDKDVNNKYKACNVEYKEEDGKYFEICHLRNYGKKHIVPTKHKVLWHLKVLCGRIADWLHMTFDVVHKKNAGHVKNCMSMMDRRARDIVKQLEKSCEGICERCGHVIGTDWSPTYMTKGWIQYICEDCAKSSKYKCIKITNSNKNENENN